MLFMMNLRPFVILMIFITSYNSKQMTYGEFVANNNLTIVSKTHSGYLEKYKGYTDVVLMHFNVPEDTSFVSFKFEADDMDFSIFGCKESDVELYMKRDSPPVINPDNSKFPPEFLVTDQSGIPLQFRSDKIPKYINISSPKPGSYFAAVYHPYTDPKSEGITQQGLTPMCSTYVDAILYAQITSIPDIIVENLEVPVRLTRDQTKVYKFFVPEAVDHALVKLSNILYCEECSGINVQIQVHNLPYKNTSLVSFDVEDVTFASEEFWATEGAWHYISFVFKNKIGTINELVGQKGTKKLSESLPEDLPQNRGSLSLKLTYFSNKLNVNVSETLYKNAIIKIHRKNYELNALSYKQYDLMRYGNTETFLYSYDLKLLENEDAMVSINLTSTDFTVLKFKLNDFIDVGGTLHFILAYKPRITRKDHLDYKKEPENHVVIACINNGDKLIPTWPNKCENSIDSKQSPIVLNKTTSNSSVLIPYPESGSWYVTLRLFCGICELCECPDNCKNEYETCRKNCENDCVLNKFCENCTENCRKFVKNKVGCEKCDCDGNCKKKKVEEKGAVCNTSVVFDVSSYPCVDGSCGKNGKCTFSVAEGFVYSSCLCTNNYKGWDCSDDSDASSFAMILLELLLLVLSNLAFLPTVYVSYKRGYKIEPIVYFSTCFFSTFYHACDAGENVISFCMVRLSVLQFSDFYCGLLSIWVTLVAMAYLNEPWPSIFHIFGSILLAFGTTYNKTSLWVFLLPFLVGVIVIGISWYWKYRKTGRLFPNKRYFCITLPFGVFVVAVALITYALLQTQSNYKYLHSLWHMLMAVGVIILLPNKETFLPDSFP